MKIITQLQKLRNKIFVMNSIPHQSNLADDRNPWLYFISVIAFYILHQLIMQPNWLLDGEMWAEMATNYYPNATASSYFQKLLSTDAGYIPAPQRLIAMIGNQLNLPTASIPYFYTWSSILITGILVGIFCLTQFRKLVKSDSLRFFTSLAILLVADFETRTFINFTYFAAFFIAIIIALAFVDDTDEIPWWAYCIPILIISKPAVLVTLPTMILAAFVSRPRFRLIVVLTIVLSLAQLVQMFISSVSGVMPFRTMDVSLTSKLLAGTKYFLGFLGGYIFGPSLPIQQFGMMLAGLTILILCVYLISFKKANSNALIIVGASLLFFNVFLNVFVLSDSWNLDMARLNGLPIYRHIIIGFFGCVLIVCGAISSATNNNKFKSLPRFIVGSGATIFIIWFLSVGWFSVAGKINREPNSPIINSSQWQSMASAIDNKITPLCVPINPWVKGGNWMYSRNCDLLTSPPAWEYGSVQVNNKLTYQIPLPFKWDNKNLVATAVLLKPLSPNNSFVEVVMAIKLKDGNTKYLIGSGNIKVAGSLLMLAGRKPISINEIADITITFNIPVEVALGINEPTSIPSFAWMGY